VSSKSVKYKDILVAPGSQLFAAIEAGDTKGAEKIYKQVMAEFHKHNPKPTATDTESK
jgi:hypothetical protein